MNLQPMTPTRVAGNGAVLTLYCTRCNVRVLSTEVRCDLDAKPGTFYCPACVATFNERE